MPSDRNEIPPPTEWPPDPLRKLIDSLESIRSEMVDLESVLSERGRDIHPSQLPSAANLMHYVALRRHDVRQIQEQLAISASPRWAGRSRTSSAQSTPCSGSSTG